MSYYNDGVKAGRDGRDPSPPKQTMLDQLTGIKKSDVDRMAKDYREGYVAGTGQRVADSRSDKGKK